MSIDTIYFRKRINGELIDLLESIAESKTSARTVKLDQTSVGRLSRMDAMQQQAMALGLAERLLLRQKKLEAALARIDAGTFGLCCACEAEIELERLHADAGTVFCTECTNQRPF